jgi:solute carrier family 10 (sodium/bile acid cotransporter), member 7
MARLRRFLLQHSLPLGLLVAAAAGILAPAPGRALAKLPTQHLAVGVIFVCAGLRLRTDEVRAALAAWPATCWGAASILLLTPLIGTSLARLVPVEEAFRTGLALFFSMPTTLSSGIALTAQARGNVALALLLTVLTNVAGIFTVPFLLSWRLDVGGHVELSAGDLLVKLSLSILLPLVVGKLLRRRLGCWADAHGEGLGLVSNMALATVPWLTFSNSSQRLAQVAPLSLLAIVLGGTAVHLVFLALNRLGAQALRLGRPETLAVVLVGSQKTLPVALTVLAFLPVSAEIKGLIAIPCVASHLSQIFVDAGIATRWRRRAG